ncbi:putative LRR receptor-like serine/threonine-protein kinase [Salvia divinorum]|uniref:LRR receptor-like serine/threonine-protein kinase n=1 Tax=Salvia divinorum TaxID=28513 RepID=A0ABD1FPD7_SALDI
MATFPSHYSLIILLISISLFTLTSSTNSTTDQDALLNFKNFIKFPNPNSTFITNWSPNTPLCNWTGVSCSATHHRVTALNLSNLALRGSLAPHLGNLTFLQSLNLSSNNFTGALPSELSKLRRLKALNVGSNDLAGEIPPAFGALSQLRQLLLGNNRFSGRIPRIFNNMSLLVEIDMSVNDLSRMISAAVMRRSSGESISRRIDSVGKFRRECTSV